MYYNNEATSEARAITKMFQDSFFLRGSASKRLNAEHTEHPICTCSPQEVSFAEPVVTIIY